jgi:hypothetical protein
MGSLLVGMVGVTPVLGTGLDIHDIIVTCPSDPLSFDCGGALLGVIPGVPGLARADDVVDATRTAERLDDAVDGAGDLAGDSARVVEDITHHREKYDIGGVHYEINTGHSFYRTHKRKEDGLITDLRTTTLTPQRIEERILGDLQANLPAVRDVNRGSKPYTGEIVIDGYTIQYRAKALPDGTVHVSSYYLFPPIL